MKRIVIRVQRRGGKTWWVKVGQSWDSDWPRQVDAVWRARRLVDVALVTHAAVQLVLHGKTGIRWERTYPRSSDPRRHKG